MQNLTRLLERENKWYKIGPILIARGIPKRVPFYFLFLLAVFYLLGELPFSPFWFVLQLKAGWVLTYLIFPAWGALWLQQIKKTGKTPEKYLWTLLRYSWSFKYVNPYRPIEKPIRVQFGTAYTYRLRARKEEIYV